MGLVGDQRKLARATMNLATLKDDLCRVVTPNLRAIILNQIAQGKNQVDRLMWKINILNQPQAPATQPLPEKKIQTPKVTKIVTKKKGVDRQNRSLVK